MPRPRSLAAAFVAMALSAVLVPVAAASSPGRGPAAQTTGRTEQCAVQSPDYGTVIVAYTLSDQAAVQIAAAQCSYLISTGSYAGVTNQVGLTDNPDFERLCTVEYSRANSLNVFRSIYQPSSSTDGRRACAALDDGSALVTYD